ncbi:hypothetical protein RMB13_08995 [Acinetobacter sp. V102_4]|uniref:hypothetical protein n=1 Tax=Acinetobacter sp. V102_4 TaxID=3072984 RepID=UPI00287E39FD|nr:hypothetical protein [Acinetobacter sp. V102_4]MDS7929614.1 hypothetical protein [Acinetobacter sp. V102_4]
MDIQSSRISIEINQQLVYSQYQSNGLKNSVYPMAPDEVYALRELIKAADQELASLEQTSGSVSYIEIQLEGKTCFSQNVPIDGTPLGTMTNDASINQKLKQILENALVQINYQLGVVSE